MDFKPIDKTPENWVVEPNLQDYDTAVSTFTWETITRQIDGLPDGRGLNIAHEAVDRHADGPLRHKIALRWLGKDDELQDFTYLDLKELSNRFANILVDFGLHRSDRVAVLAGRIPELYLAALGTLKAGCVFMPLFSAFGPEPIFQRLQKGKAKVLVTTQKLYAKKVADLRDRLPDLRVVLLTDVPEDVDETVLSFHKHMAAAPVDFTIPPTDPEDMALLHFTSGTTGMPKGAVHVHNAVYHHYYTAQMALDLHQDDIFWCTADPGWVTGTSYGIIAPLLHGVTNIVDEAEFDAERWYRILEEQKVTVWYTAPTAIRRLMRLDMKPRDEYDLSHLRFVASVGEPLNPEAVVWGKDVLDLDIHDNWWQTETGGILISNYAAMQIRPGSMGRPLPGITAAILRRLDDGTVEIIDKPGVDGDLAIKPGWPSMFRAYLDDDERYQKCFVDGWYISGDLAMQDADGYFWFVGRADDIIKTAGHMVGPFEVESALLEHPAVAEAGVIGVPNEVIGQLVKAFVSLKPGYTADDRLRMELLGFGRKKLGSAVAPKEIEFMQNLPKTRSGKIMRRLLKARELGLDEGDVSTLETAVDKDHALHLLKEMLRIRRLEEKSAEMYTKMKIRGFLHLYIGEEAVAVGAMQALRPEDTIIATYREHGQALARGMSMEAIMAEMYGKMEGCSRGRGGSMHLFDKSLNFIGGNAIVGGGLPLAVGAALADKMRGLDHVTVCFFGDGACAEGEFHESLNLAALWQVPVLFILENNQYAMGTALSKSHCNTNLAERAATYNVQARKIDGMDVLTVEEAVKEAVSAIHAGQGPQFLEIQTYRFRAHSMFDAELYREKLEVEEWKERDPILVFIKLLQEQHLLTEDELAQMEVEVMAEVETAVAFAEAAQWEPIAELERFVYTES
ncbi:MAG: acetate--CoA ligase [Ardenticatenaceae bacterium]|nr:acetate--CoA ligase [Ardenticatenaceae bacterium]